MKDPRTVILIDRDPFHANVFETSVLNSPDGPFRGEWIRSLTDGLRRVQQKDVWAVFLNLRLSGALEISLVDKLIQGAPGVQILVLAGADDELTALEALRHGAKD
jgi:DNA-binding NarL/FixJ family response regulator